MLEHDMFYDFESLKKRFNEFVTPHVCVIVRLNSRC